jgi:tetraacyldisaccharide 4'-kinase
MKAPSFWYDTSNRLNLLARALIPLGSLYAHVGQAIRTHKSPRAASLPVICVGNLVVGGSGKTPTALAILDIIRQEKIFLSPAFLTRGYGGAVRGPERVDPQGDASIWGDESLLLARHAPTFIARNRYNGVEMIREYGHDVVILDDGLQHTQLKKDISLCVIDGATGFGNGEVMPAGPLRQSLREGFDLCDAFIVVNDDIRRTQNILPTNKKVFTAHLVPRDDIDLSENGDYVAFCGIAFPEKFRKSLNTCRAKVINFHVFDDHHPYNFAEIGRLVDEALRHNARLITTEKDFVRLPDFARKNLIDVLPIALSFDEPTQIAHLISTLRSA